MPTTVTDDFGRDVSDLLGEPWVESENNLGGGNSTKALTIVAGGKLRATSAFAAGNLLFGAAIYGGFDRDQTSALVFDNAVGADPVSGPAIRFIRTAGSGDFTLAIAAIYDPAGSYHGAAGVPFVHLLIGWFGRVDLATLLAQAAVTLVAGDELKVGIVGNTVTVYKNGASVFSHILSAGNALTYRAGLAGIACAATPGSAAAEYIEWRSWTATGFLGSCFVRAASDVSAAGPGTNHVLTEPVGVITTEERDDVAIAVWYVDTGLTLTPPANNAWTRLLTKNHAGTVEVWAAARTPGQSFTGTWVSSGSDSPLRYMMVLQGANRTLVAVAAQIRSRYGAGADMVPGTPSGERYFAPAGTMTRNNQMHFVIGAANVNRGLAFNTDSNWALLADQGVAGRQLFGMSRTVETAQAFGEIEFGADPGFPSQGFEAVLIWDNDAAAAAVPGVFLGSIYEFGGAVTDHGATVVAELTTRVIDPADGLHKLLRAIGLEFEANPGSTLTARLIPDQTGSYLEHLVKLAGATLSRRFRFLPGSKKLQGNVFQLYLKSANGVARPAIYTWKLMVHTFQRRDYQVGAFADVVGDPTIDSGALGAAHLDSHDHVM